ncbi:MAG: hypothetical protein ABIY56_10380 [Dokdonella sp.]
MITKKMSRFFGLIPVRFAAEPSAPVPRVPERPKPEHKAVDPAPVPPQDLVDASGSLMRELELTSHANESRLTDLEKRTAWALPALVVESNDDPVAPVRSKARLLMPALDQMRETQASLMSGTAVVVKDEAPSSNQSEASSVALDTESLKSRPKRRRAARPIPALASAQQPAPQEQTRGATSVRPKREGTQKPVPTQIQPAAAEPIQPTDTPPTVSQPTPATSQGWQYTVMLQRAEGSASSRTLESGVDLAAAGDASNIGLMFQRLRSHSEKPPTQLVAVSKAPGFLHKLWAK